MLALTSAHLVVWIIYFALLPAKGAVWHCSYIDTVPSVNDIDTVGGVVSFKKRAYSRLVAPEHTAAVCATAAPVVSESDAWQQRLYSREHDMCVFKQVTAVMDRPADPRDLSILASGTPYFLLITAQALVLSHMYWSASPLVAFGTMPRSLWPADLVVSSVLPLVWLVVSFAVQMRLTIVYNNMLIAVIASCVVVVLEVCWTVQSAGAPREAPAVDQPKSDLVSMSLTDRINVSIIMQPTRVPIMPLEQQGTRSGAWRTVTDVVGKLAAHNLLAVPRLMLLPVVLAFIAAASLFAAGSIWRHAEVAMVVLVAVMATVMNVPLFVIARVANENTANGDLDRYAWPTALFSCFRT